MENPLKKHGEKVASRLNIAREKDQTLSKLVESKKSKKMTNREIKEQEELVIKFEREQEEMKKRKMPELEAEDSDSDVGRENKKKIKNEKKSKGGTSTGMNIKRKPRKKKMDVSEGAPDLVITQEMLIREDGPEIDRKKVPKNALAIYSKDLNQEELKFLSAREIQKKDSENPLPIQKFFYMDPERRDAIISNRSESDKEYFQRGLVNTQLIRDRMSSTLEKVRNGPSVTWTAKSKEEFVSAVLKSVNIVTRRDEEGMLRTAREGERNCLNDSQCEGNFIPNARKVTLVEYLSPEERARFKEKGELPSHRKLCVMCIRKFVAYHYINARSECKSSTNTNWLASKFGNIVDQHGEYCLEQTIMTNGNKYQSIPVPVVLHVRKGYRQVVDDKEGVTYFIQDPSFYKMPEDVKKELFH